MTAAPHSDHGHGEHGHTTGAKDPAITSTSQKVWGFFSAFFVLIAIGLTIFGVRGCLKEKNAREETKAKAKAEASAIAASRQDTVVVERPWTFRTFEIPKTGLPLVLHRGWRSWSTGAITITDEDGKVYKDSPEITTRINHKDGYHVYIFLPDPAGSQRKVEIYNRW